MIVKPVYGAQYPPLQTSSAAVGVVGSPTKTDTRFRHYENSTSDVWDAGVTVDDDLALTSAARVLELHAANQPPSFQQRGEDDDAIMPNCNPTPIRNNRQQAMQRLATQQPKVSTMSQPSHHHQPTSGGAGATSHHHSGGLYPRLPEFGGAAAAGPSSAAASTRQAGGPPTVQSMAAVTAGRSGLDQSRFDRLRRVLGVRSPAAENNNGGGSCKTPAMIDIEDLRRDCWLGIPHKVRPHAWRILSGYVPTNLDRRAAVLRKKREEYWHYVEHYFHTRYDDQHQVTFRQIHIDIPRMCPLIPLFQQKQVQEIFERILYIWAIRHPASGYVQGINDLVTPFFVVYLSEFIADDVEVGTFDIGRLARADLELVEADSFWCVSALLDTIQDNYTFAQPGIQRKVQDLRDLLSRVDRNLFQHFENHGVEFLQFAFRWMNNLLMREIPLRATIRLWDTYLSEKQGFSQFHTYVCGAFLRMWSRQLQTEKDFQGIILLLQNLPTQGWNDQNICELTADAYSLMQMFHGARNHFQQ